MSRLLTYVAASTAALLAGTAFAASPAAAYPEPNDMFAAAKALNGNSGSVPGANFKATKEPGEPLHAGNAGGASLWYRWVAPSDGSWLFTAWQESGDPVLAVYTGSAVNALVEVASNDDWSGFSSRVIFDAAEATEYWIAVDGYGGQAGHFELDWNRRLPNDDFAAAAVIEGPSGHITGSNRGATAEPGEPMIFGGDTSVWYRWTVQATAHVRFDTRGSNFDTVLGVYTGSAVDALVEVASNDDGFGIGLDSEVSFLAEAGATYAIVVAGLDGDVGGFVLNWYPGAIIVGTAGADVLEGTPGDDLIFGQGGADRIFGYGGADHLLGDGGPDRLYGGLGPDRLNSRDGRRGNDAVYGGRGSDTARVDRGDLVRGVP